MNVRILCMLALVLQCSVVQAEQFIATDVINNQNPVVTEPIIQLVEAYNHAIKRFGNYEQAFMYITTADILKKLPCYAYFKATLFKGDDQKTIDFLCYKMIDIYMIFAER